MNARDRLFAYFIGAMILVVMLYGTGMIVVILWDGETAISSRLVSGFGAMFAGILGLGSGYLLGVRSQNGDNGNRH